MSSFAGTAPGTESGTEIIRVENVGIQALGYAELATAASHDDERLVRIVALASNGRYLVAVRSNIGIMRMKGAYLDSALTVEDGNFSFYYANGRIESEGHYQHGSKSGTWLRYAMDGAQMAERNYTGLNTEELLKAEMGGSTIGEIITEQIARIGEKIELTEYEMMEAPLVAPYIHMGNKAGVIVGLNLSDSNYINAGRDIAMQVAAMKPVALDKDGVSQDLINKEIEIGKELARGEGKAEDMLEKIAIGKLNKFFKENTLLNQIFVKDGKISVADYLKSINPQLTAIGFKHVSLG